MFASRFALMEHSAHELDHFRDRVCPYECAVITKLSLYEVGEIVDVKLIQV